ncbi:MAG TPA: alcohol dehydrogenase catalytic domain-containing protein [Kofleriaceae bacterium]|nr:alcohol dehydrogenase catalytic domain-containing protein [Kofleriaceae bacterium]
MSSLGEDEVAIAVDAVQDRAAIGRVIEHGPRAAGLQDRVVLVGPIEPCGECEVCRRGGAAVCPRAKRRDTIAGTVVAAARWVTPLGDGLALPVPAGAAVAGDVALAYTLYARTGLGPREPVVVVGASPVTRFVVEILRAKSITPVVVVEPGAGADAWTAWLEQRGATVARAASVDETYAAIAGAIASHGTGARPWRIVATTSPAATLAARLAGPRATLTVLAPIDALPGELAAREVTVIGVAGAHPDLVVEAAAMCAKGEIDLIGGTSETAEPMRSHVRRVAT